MRFFQQVFEKLFSANEIESKSFSQKEFLKRTTKENENFEKWKNDWIKKKSLLQEVSRAYSFHKAGIASELPLYFLEMNGMKGFAITCTPAFDDFSYVCLMEWIKEKLLQMHYRVLNAERMLTDKGEDVEIKESYYLKPSNKIEMMNGQQLKQLYGNITLDITYRNHHPQFFKIIVTYYTDKNYKPALDFDDLIQELLLSD